MLNSFLPTPPVILSHFYPPQITLSHHTTPQATPPFADFYDIRVDDFFKEEKAKIKMTRKSRRWFIFGLSETLVWLVFGVFFSVFSIALPNVFAWWLLFVYAAAASAILAVVWAGIYHKRLYLRLIH